MKTEKQIKRREQIEAAAYELLAEKGYKATSMLAIAKRASASNETLYNWYGTKQAVFSALVAANAQSAREILDDAHNSSADPLKILEQLGPALLQIVTSEKAVALNRAAAIDMYETRLLGKTIAAGGKKAILPLLRKLFLKARASKLMVFDDDNDVAKTYIFLLIGDVQIERVIGVRPVLTRKQITARANKATELILRLYGTAGAG